MNWQLTVRDNLKVSILIGCNRLSMWMTNEYVKTAQWSQELGGNVIYMQINANPARSSTDVINVVNV